jgi:hypothetical protein
LQQIVCGSFLQDRLFRRAHLARYHCRTQSLPIQVTQKPVEVLESLLDLHDAPDWPRDLRTHRDALSE